MLKKKKKKKEAISKHAGAWIRQSNHEDTGKKQTLPVALRELGHPQVRDTTLRKTNQDTVAAKAVNQGGFRDTGQGQ